MTESVSESENPAIPSPTPKTDAPRTNRDWWPNQLDLSVLHWHSSLTNPLDEGFDYNEEFKSLDLDALRRDVLELMTASQDWWPADSLQSWIESRGWAPPRASCFVNAACASRPSAWLFCGRSRMRRT